MDPSSPFLIQAIVEGSEEAFDLLFRQYYAPLCVIGESWVQDEDTARCIVQECFIKFWEKRHEAARIGNLYGYLAHMVRNRCIDHLRQQETERRVKEALPRDTGRGPVTEEQVMADELTVRIGKAIEQLPPRCRTAFVLSRREGLTYPQIAEKMGISLKGVEALIARALKSLREELSDYFR